MRVAVIGATGMLGRRLVQALAARGDEAVAVVRSGEVPGAARTAVWDGDGEVPAAAFAGCDAVVNLAGAPIATRWNDEVKRAIVTSRVDLTGRVAAALAPADAPRVLINASAVGYYGARDQPVDETAMPGSGFLPDVCVRWEAAATAASRHGVRVVLLRTGIVLAVEGGALPEMLGPAKLGLGGPIAGGRQWFPWIHVDDDIGLILFALDRADISGPVNLVAPGIVRQGDFARALGEATHRPAILPTPGFALRVLFGEGGQVLTEGQHVVPAVATRAGYAFRFPELGPALADLVG